MEAVFAIPIAMGIGWWADSKLDTSPWLLLTGLGFGFAAFVIRIVKMRQLVEAASEEHRDDEPS
ncbi:MAG: AtpZ/AtpI family protein [Myxococcota bacterium]|nr:AtpZ/AtpI family protein [Myxococcota bacterium]